MKLQDLLKAGSQDVWVKAMSLFVWISWKPFVVRRHLKRYPDILLEALDSEFFLPVNGVFES